MPTQRDIEAARTVLGLDDAQAYRHAQQAAWLRERAARQRQAAVTACIERLAPLLRDSQ